MKKLIAGLCLAALLVAGIGTFGGHVDPPYGMNFQIINLK